MLFELLKYSFIVVIFCCLVACISMPLDLQDDRLASLDTSYEIPKIPFYPQVEDQCGPSSLATMLDVQGIKISPEQLRGKLYIPGKQGTLTTEMIARARRYGLLVYPLDPDIVNVLSEINAGNPVLVMQNLGFEWLPAWHFSVAFGYDLDRRTIFLRSGMEFKQEMGFKLFLKTWERANLWAVVMVKPDRLPQTATAKGIIHSANQLEQVGEVNAALQAYKAVLQKWPSKSIASFGAGNAAYALGDYVEAEQFFFDYLKLQSNSSIAWNNLAYSFAEQGCISEAEKAIQCALEIDPENKNLLDSGLDISQYPARTSKSQCRQINCQLDDSL